MIMRSPVRWLSLLAAVAVVGAVLWWRVAGTVLDVQTAVVTRGSFEETLVEDARTRVRWHVDVTAPVTGEWSPADLQVGDTVTAGTLLGTLTSAPADPSTTLQLRAQLGVAEASLLAARAMEAEMVAALGEAQRAQGRAERLGAAGGVTDEELDRIRTLTESRTRERDAARARVSAAVFARDAARAALPGGGGRVRVTAPGAGVILRLDEAHPRIVPAGAPLVMVGATDLLEVVVDVLSSDAARIPVGAPMWLQNGMDTITAHVLRVEPVAHTVRSALGVDEQRVSVIGDIHDGGDRLGHDFEVRARIVLSRRDGVLVVPAGALVRDGEAWTIFVLDAQGVARAVPVQVVARGAEQAIVDGVDEGARVVVHPPEALASGAKVRTGG